MRDTGGQLYTIEGIAAGLIMIMTAYLVVNATSVYTAGDTHISDMQLESVGSDALKMMGAATNTSENLADTSPLRVILENPGSVPNATFRTRFLELANNRTGVSSDYSAKIGSTMDYIQFTANYSCRNTTNNNAIESYPVSYSRNLTGGEHTVRATKWVIVNKKSQPLCGTTNTDRAVLVEVLLWRD